MNEIDSFEKTFSEKKAALLSNLQSQSSEDARKGLVDQFLREMQQKSFSVLQSQSYASVQVRAADENQPYSKKSLLKGKSDSMSPVKVHYGSPEKQKSPDKENSPLKRMGSLRK